MVRFISPLCLMLIISMSAFAQSKSKADSLLHLLNISIDTARVNLLNDLGFEMLFTAPHKTDSLGRLAIELADQLGYRLGEARGYRTLGIAQDIRGNYAEAIQAFESGLTIIDKLDSGSSSVLKVKSALLTGIGLSHYHMGDFKQAITQYLKALPIIERQNNASALAMINNNLGLVYHDMKELDRALAYYLASEKIASENGAINVAGRAANNAGLIFQEKENYDKALEYYDRSLKYKNQLGDANGISATFQNMGVVYKRRGQYRQALDLLDSAAAMKRRINDKLGMTKVLDTKADLLIELRKFKEAKALIDENKQLAEAIKSQDAMLLVYDRYYEWNKVQNNYKEALFWIEKRMALDDSLVNEATSRQIEDLQARYQLNKRESEILRLKADGAYQQLRHVNFIVVMIMLIALSAIGFVWVYQKRRSDKKSFDAKNELAHAELINAQLREDDLKRELEHKSRELTSYTINFIQKTKLIEEFRESIQGLSGGSSADVVKKVANLERVLDTNFQIDREWEDFKLYFEKVHSGFFDELKASYPDLTSGDLKLCALLKLRMNVKESAKILGISPDSVKTARYRLRKKLQLSKNEALFDFMFRFDVEATED